MDALHFVILLAAAFVAGAINAVAGGGTLFTFTALGLILPLKLANATNSALLTPASAISATAFAKELREQWRVFVALLLPTFLGAYSGAVVFTNTTDDVFRRSVPFLILFAVVLFGFKDRIATFVKNIRGTQAATRHENTFSPLAWVWGLGFQFLVAFYGGYFGAGIGILMIASFSLMGMRDMHRMNALKNLLAFFINGVAAIKFISDGLIVWSLALPLAVMAMSGGFIAARLSRRMNQKYLRAFVIAYGCCVSAFLFARYWLGWLS